MSERPDIVLDARELSKSFGGIRAVQGVNLKIHRGTIHALIGPNGAGKTTVFNLLTKFLPPTSGSITLNGNDITHSTAAQVARMGMVRSFQISATFGSMTALENVRVALAQRAGFGYRFWRARRELYTLHERAEQLLDEVGLAENRDTRAGELPYGRKRALEIATTLALDPEVLLLDEPTSGMGHEDVDRTKALIKRVSANRTILLVEHNLSVVSTLSNWITVLTRGSVLAEGTYAQIAGDKRVVEAYLGTDDD